MILGILSDTHDHLQRTRRAVDVLIESKAEALVHCGDLSSPEIVKVCSQLPFYFALGNHDADMAAILNDAADQYGSTCLNWGSEITLDRKRIAVAHGHLPQDYRPLLSKEPDYFLFGHSHQKHDQTIDGTRRINPGALYRASDFSVALLDLGADALEYVSISR